MSRGGGGAGASIPGMNGACLNAIAKVEGGTPGVCRFDVNSNSCGTFQIKKPYWQDCGKPGGSWEKCAADEACSRQCIQTYTARYSGICAKDLGKDVNELTCTDLARLHNGGPKGCSKEATKKYEDKVQKALDKDKK